MKYKNGPSLTRREIEILQLIAEGKSTTEIAETASLRPSTVFTHRKNILRKTGEKNIMAVIMLAMRHKIIAIKKR